MQKSEPLKKEATQTFLLSKMIQSQHKTQRTTGQRDGASRSLKTQFYVLWAACSFSVFLLNLPS